MSQLSRLVRTVIYFIQDSDTLHVKIGYTGGDPKVRLADLQTGNPSRLVLLAATDGGQSDEAVLHRRFAAHRVAGEWFNPAPELLLHVVAAGSRGVGRAAYAEGYAVGRDSVPAGSPVLRPDGSWCGPVCDGQNSPTLLVHCPVCGFDYNHVGGTVPVYGYEPCRKGPRPNDGIDWSGRGDGVAVRMWCENGHDWLFCLGFHKGNTSFFTAAPAGGPEQGSAAPVSSEGNAAG